VPVKQIDANSHIYIRQPVYGLEHLLPHTHDDESKLSFKAFLKAFPLLSLEALSPVSRADLSKFVYTDMNLAISDMLRSADSTSFHLEVAVPSEMEATLRFCSVKLVKIKEAGLVKDFHPRPTYKPDCDLLFFRYANENSDAVNAGLVIGLRNGAPWCNILRNMSLVDYSVFQFEIRNWRRLMETLDKSMDGAGTRGKTSDFCRMRIGAAKYNAYLVTRVRKISCGSDSQYSRLILEIAVDFPTVGRDCGEAGVLDCELQVYRGSSLVKEVGEDDIVLESCEEPPEWRIQGRNMMVTYEREEYTS
jgi:hypothetical protein